MDTSGIIDKSLADFESNLAQVVRQYRQSVSSLLANLQTVEGKFITATDANVNFISQNYAAFNQLLLDAGYPELVQSYLNDEAGLIAQYEKLRPKGAVPLAFTAKTTDQITALRNAELFNFELLGRDVVNTLQRETMRVVLAGGSTETMTEAVAASLDTHLQRYAWTYANTARANFLQQVEDIATDRAERIQEGDEIYWEYIGPTDDLNRPACVQGLDKQFFTDAERIQFEAETAEERAWNCRHTFMEITKEYYEQNTR